MLGKYFKDILANDLKETGPNGCAYEFSVDNYSTIVNNILEIYKYLMKKLKIN